MRVGKNLIQLGLMLAVSALGCSEPQSGAVDVTAYAIQWQGASHWVFLWVTPVNQTRQLSGAIDRSVRSLRDVQPGSVSVPAPTRVDVVTAQRGDSVSALSQYMAFPSYRQERFLIINGLGADSGITAGERYKLVR